LVKISHHDWSSYSGVRTEAKETVFINMGYACKPMKQVSKLWGMHWGQRNSFYNWNKRCFVQSMSSNWENSSELNIKH